MTSPISLSFVTTLPPGVRALRIERVECYTSFSDGTFDRPAYWKIWLDANPTFTRGNFLALYDDGRVEQVHVSESYEKTFELIPIMEEDKDE